MSEFRASRANTDRFANSVEIGDFEGSSIQWKATIPAGTIVQISVADSSDDEAWSKNVRGPTFPLSRVAS